MIYTETSLYRAWETYNKAIGHRFYFYAHSIILLLLYEGLLFFSYNPHVLAHNGVDFWFKISRFLPKGTLLVSLTLIGVWLWRIRQDWLGKKNSKERKRDRDQKKRNAKYIPKPKLKFRPNWHYFGFQALEGFVYSGLLQMLLPPIIYVMLWLFTTENGTVDVPFPLDANDVFQDYHTNFVQDMALAFGAGFYEEIIFRGYLFAGLLWISNKISYLKTYTNKTQTVQVDVVKFSLPKYNPRDRGFLLAILVGTFLYAFSHYLIPFGDALSWYSFVYRFFFGLIMYFIFVNRGFPVAAWTHAFYDLWYFVLN